MYLPIANLDTENSNYSLSKSFCAKLTYPIDHIKTIDNF